MADEFKPEFDLLAQGVRNEVLALARVLQEFGPQLGRPRVDTLKGSRHANMKELRFSEAVGEWRVAFALTTCGRRFCSWPETNPAGAKSASIAN
jgi:hypothetical protein